MRTQGALFTMFTPKNTTCYTVTPTTTKNPLNHIIAYMAIIAVTILTVSMCSIITQPNATAQQASTPGRSIDFKENSIDEKKDQTNIAEKEAEERKKQIREAQELLKKAYGEYETRDEEENNGGSANNGESNKFKKFQQLVEKADAESPDSKIRTNTFGDVVRRLLSLSYINETPEGFNAHPQGNCNPFDPKAGTILYHNCDIPNIFTQLVQTTAASLVQTGAVNAEQNTAKVSNPAFGLPDNIPDSGAAIEPNARFNKYTGLELFGYNFRYSSYQGEWDDIRVQNSARALSGMGTFDRIRATFKAISKGLGSSTNVAAQRVSEGLSSGNVFSAVTGGFSGLYSGFIGGSINSILDTSDQNVFDQTAWYRSNFAQTMYGARELSQEEIANEMQRLIMEYMHGITLEDVYVPEELKKIKEIPEPPEEAISFCSVVPQNEFTTPPPGISKEECFRKWEELVAATEGGAAAVAPFEWTIDGTRKQEPLRDYRQNYPKARPEKKPPDYFNISQRFGVNCVPEGDLDNYWDIPPANSPENIKRRKEYYAKISSCWSNAWQRAVDEKLKQDQNARTGENVKKKFSGDEFHKWIKQDEQNRNYNAPWRRYVCVDENERDIRGSHNEYVFLYDMNGVKNPLCMDVRSPIQDGLFGNGYPTQGIVPKDTRNTIPEKTVGGLLMPMGDIFTNFGEIGLNIAVFATRVSNAAVNLAYGTILDKLDLDKIIVKAMEQLRDGLYYPLVVLFASFGAIYIFIRAFKGGMGVKTFQDLIILVFLVMLGAGLMHQPQKLVDWVERVPAEAEQGILGAVFNDNSGGGDELCTTNNNSNIIGQNDKGRDRLSDDALRRLMCENWRLGLYNVWAYGQWGTAPQNLDTNKMRNTNTHLVGDAAVNMGGGTTVNNWALYQLDVMSTGTASFADPKTNTGATPRDFYRIVDMQAGPNDGAGTDPRYFRTWSGMEGGNRIAVGVLGAASSIMLSLTVTSYALAKLQINITMLLMLLLLPIMLLVGLSHAAGRRKMKAYLATLVALALQRAALALLLAIVFRFMYAISNSPASAPMALIGTFVIAAIFYGIRKEVFGIIGEDVGRFSGGEKQMYGHNAGELQLPGYIQSKARRLQVGTNAIVGGTIGGFAAGGLSGTEGTVKRAFNSQMAYIRRLQRYRGKGATQTFFEASWNAQKEANADIDRTSIAQNIYMEANRTSKAHKGWERKLAEYDKFEGEEKKTLLGDIIKVNNVTGEVKKKPKSPKPVNADTAGNRFARKTSSTIHRVQKDTRKFEAKLNNQNIALNSNGEYVQYGGRDLQNVIKRARKHDDNNWENYIYDGEDVTTQRLTRTQQLELQEQYKQTGTEQRYNKNMKKQVGTARRKQNRKQTKENMRDALIEAREAAGKKFSEREHF